MFQARARLEAQELIQRTFKRENGDALIKQLTDTIEEAMVAIGLFDEKLAALPEHGEGGVSRDHQGARCSSDRRQAGPDRRARPGPT